MTQRDVWLKPPRPPVAHYQEFKTRAIEAWANLCGKKFSRASISVEFFVPGDRRVDLSNLLKAVEDALLSYAWDDDDINTIYEYKLIKANRVIKDEPGRTVLEIVGYTTIKDKP